MIDNKFIGIMEALEIPTLSVDKLVLLVHSPKLSLYEFDREEIDYNYAYKQKNRRIKKFIDTFYISFESLITKTYEKTPLYKYHFQLLDNFDIQICPRMGIKSRIKDKEIVERYGTDDDKKNGYIDEYFDSEYGIRIEYNPNKSDIKDIQSFLNLLAIESNIFFDDLIKISRIDIAIDYPQNINPCLSLCKRARKNFTAGGTGGVQSVYYGGRGSKDYFRIYNKKIELAEVQKIDYKGSFLWRVELEYKAGFKIGRKPNFLDSFNKLYFHGNAHKTGDWKLDCLLEKCHHWGMQNALADLPVNTRIRYKEQIIQLQCTDFVQPKDIYSEQFPFVWKELKYTLRDCFDRSEYKESQNDKLYHLEQSDYNETIEIINQLVDRNIIKLDDLT